MQAQQQQNNSTIRAVRTRRLTLNAAQKEALEVVFRSEPQPNFALGEQRGRLVNGVPAEFRNYIWTQLIPNQHAITPGNYSQLLQQLALHRSRHGNQRHALMSSSPRKQQRQSPEEAVLEKKQEQNPEVVQEPANKIIRWIETIAQDIPRTFPELRIFHNDEEQREKLSNILGCFALYRPDVGYIQGLSLIGALFLQQLNNEYRAFTALANLITNTPLLYDFYTFNETTRDALTSNIIKKLEEANASVAQFLLESKVEIKMIVMEWVMTLFCRVFQLDSIPNIWDILLAHRLTNNIVEDLCVAIIHAHREDILCTTEPALIGKLLRNTRLTFSQEEEVFATLRSLEVASE